MDEKHVNEIDGNIKRSYCEKLFCTERGLQQHCRITNCQTNQRNLKLPTKQRKL